MPNVVLASSHHCRSTIWGDVRGIQFGMPWIRKWIQERSAVKEGKFGALLKVIWIWKGSLQHSAEKDGWVVRYRKCEPVCHEDSLLHEMRRSCSAWAWGQEGQVFSKVFKGNRNHTTCQVLVETNILLHCRERSSLFSTPGNPKSTSQVHKFCLQPWLVRETDDEEITDPFL